MTWYAITYPGPPSTGPRIHTPMVISLRYGSLNNKTLLLPFFKTNRMPLYNPSNKSFWNINVPCGKIWEKLDSFRTPGISCR